MSLAERRRALGYSQEALAQVLGVDRTTISRWEAGRNEIQPPLRAKYAEILGLELTKLDELVNRTKRPSSTPIELPTSRDATDTDEMMRREFLRALALLGTVSLLAEDEADGLTARTQRRSASELARMNQHLWQVYQLARVKGTVYPVVRDQLLLLNDSLRGPLHGQTQALCEAAASIYQLAGELAFDANHYTDAAASYALAASASKDVQAFDLWACSLVRHAYIDLHSRDYRAAEQTLQAAACVARRGNSSLPTRYWVASVLAEAHAGLGNLVACERALDEAEKVLTVRLEHNDGWLRFDGSRLAEERGARYVHLGRLDLAEACLQEALKQEALAPGLSFRRRGAVLVDLARVGAKRRDVDQVIAYGDEALHLARSSVSGYILHRLSALRSEISTLGRDDRIATLSTEIEALATAR
ncbi:helix-turn-helix domain-containing protein [Streptomyces mobaraensis]|uniref:helix-turn-helix domain-containing protein n=1 Tax=Streptomyces mobaraensis TaxID=35621 RepID=UPI00340B8A40